MSEILVFLDESGDLGWKFHLPYGNGGSSRYLTLGCVLCPANKKKYIDRAIRRFHKTVEAKSPKEVKWGFLDQDERIKAALKLKLLIDTHPEIELLAISLNKESIPLPARKSPHQVYMDMIRRLLLKKMKDYDDVSLVHDQSCLESREIQRDLQLKLWVNKNAETILTTTSSESHLQSSIQAADLLAGLVQGRLEHKQKAPWDALASYIQYRYVSF